INLQIIRSRGIFGAFVVEEGQALAGIVEEDVLAGRVEFFLAVIHEGARTARYVEDHIPVLVHNTDHDLLSLDGRDVVFGDIEFYLQLLYLPGPEGRLALAATVVNCHDPKILNLEL